MKCCVEPNLMPHSDQPFMLAKRSLCSLAVRRRALIPVIRAAAASWRAPRSRRRGTRFASSAATHSRLEHPIPGTIVCVTFRHRRIEMWPDHAEQDGMAGVKKPPTFAPLGTYQHVIAGANHNNPLRGTKQCIQSQDISRVRAFLLSLQADGLGSHSLEWHTVIFRG